MTSRRLLASDSPRGRARVVEVLGAFAFAADLGAGQPLGHALRTVRLSMELADRLSLDDVERLRTFHTSFLAHAGCTAGTGDFAAVTANEMAAYGDLFVLDPTNRSEVLDWLIRHRPEGRSDPDMRALAEEIGPRVVEHTRGVCEVGYRIAERLGLSGETAGAVKHTFEFWDGSGPYGLHGEAIPIASRVTLAALVMDSIQYLQGWDAAQAAARRRSGAMLEPAIVEALGQLPAPEIDDRSKGSWESSDELWQSVLASDPTPRGEALDSDRLKDVIQAFADFTEIKDITRFGHSRDTTSLAVGMARRFGMSGNEIQPLRWAALVHDFGNVAVPLGVLRGMRPPTGYEQEQLRLHPYYTERILGRVSALGGAARIASMHHEYLDGSGGYRGLSGEAIPLEARILAVACRYDEIARAAGAPAPEGVDEALSQLQLDAGTRFDPDCLRALHAEVHGARLRKPLRRSHPRGLTDREVEVLQLIARGLTNREMATELTLSDRTIGRHIENIYNKLGVSSRAASTLFALEHDLLGRTVSSPAGGRENGVNSP
jgi:HD-GYP domain-containing protein (c-di-GMP phosphodiesterase class II)